MTLSADIATCTACPRRSACSAPTPPDERPADLLLLWESPSGDLLQTGPEAELLASMLPLASIASRDVADTALVRCAGRTAPSDAEILACAGFLARELRTLRPRVIVALGSRAASVCASMAESLPSQVARGAVFEIELHGATVDVVCSLAPGAVLAQRGPSRVAAESQLVADLAVARGLVAQRYDVRRGGGAPRVVDTYLPAVGFVHGWFSGPRMFLVGRNDSGRFVHEVPRGEAPYYFLVHRSDLTAATQARFDGMLHRGFTVGKEVVSITSTAPDPWQPNDWLRVYVPPPLNWVSRCLKVGMDDFESRRYLSRSPLLTSIVRGFEVVGVRSYEADVDPLRRFLTDRQLTIVPPRRVYIALVIDDARIGSGAAEIGASPIVAVAYADDDGAAGSFVMDQWTSDAEGRLLRRVAALLAQYDAVVAWNGDGYAFPYLCARWRQFGIDGGFYALVPFDFAALCKRNRVACDDGSFTLDAVCRSNDVPVFGSAECSAVRDMWREDREVLSESVVARACQMRDLERGVGVLALESRTSNLANGFASQQLVSERVEGMALRVGYRVGTHFPTREPADDRDTFEGGVVLDPVIGLHENVEVADFRALYPSLMRCFNLSPDTFVPADIADRYAAADVSKLPDGSVFMRQPKGILSSVLFAASVRRKKASDAGDTMTADAWKTLAASVYGATGYKPSRYYRREVASAVTATGRALFARVLRTIGERARVVYGDTDSVFVSGATAELWADVDAAIAAFVAEHNGEQGLLVLRREERFAKLLLIGKKQYVAQRDDGVQIERGVEARRSDATVAEREAQKEMAEAILEDGSEAAVRALLTRWRRAVLRGDVPISDAVETVVLHSLPEEYESKGPHVRAAELLRARGTTVYPGMRVSFVVTDGSSRPLQVETLAAATGYDRVFFWNAKVLPALSRLAAAHDTRFDMDAWKATSIDSDGTGDLF